MVNILFLYALSESFKVFPALNFATFASGISTSLPSCGFLPVLAGRTDDSKVPKPTSCTLSSAFKASVSTSISALTALSVSAFFSPLFSLRLKLTHSLSFFSPFAEVFCILPFSFFCAFASTQVYQYFSIETSLSLALAKFPVFATCCPVLLLSSASIRMSDNSP